MSLCLLFKESKVTLRIFIFTYRVQPVTRASKVRWVAKVILVMPESQVFREILEELVPKDLQEALEKMDYL